MDVASRTIGRTGVSRRGAAAVVQRVSQPRRSWIGRLLKSIADFFRRRRFGRNRATLRPPREKSGRAAGG